MARTLVGALAVCCSLVACRDSSARDGKGFDGILTLPESDTELAPAEDEPSAEADSGTLTSPSDGGRDAGACLDGGRCGVSNCADGGCLTSGADAGMCSATKPCPISQVCHDGVCDPAPAIGGTCVPGRLCGTGAHCLNSRCVPVVMARYCHCLSLSGRPASLRLQVADVDFPYTPGLTCSPCQPVPTGKNISYRVIRQDGSLERESTLNLDPSWNNGEVSIYSIVNGAGVFEFGCTDRVVCPSP